MGVHVPTTVLRALFLVAVFAVCCALRRSRWKAPLAGQLLALLLAAAAIGRVYAVRPMPLPNQPSPDSHELADAARQLAARQGYVVRIYGGKPLPPRYPPGTSLALAAGLLGGGDDAANVQRAATTLVALYVLISIVLAWQVGGPLAAAITAAVLGVAPFTLQQAALILSDPLAAAITIAIPVVLRHETRPRTLVAGFLAAASVTVRLPMILNLIALLLALRRHRFWALAGAVPCGVALMSYNWTTFGSPFRTGYWYWHLDARAFVLSNAWKTPPLGDGPWVVSDLLRGTLMQWVCPCPIGGSQGALPNIFFYPLVMLGVFWIVAPPLMPIAGAVGLIRRRSTAAARFSIAVIGLTMLLYVIYFYQGARFMAAPLTLLVIYAAAEIVGWCQGVIPSVDSTRNDALEFAEAPRVKIRRAEARRHTERL